MTETALTYLSKLKKSIQSPDIVEDVLALERSYLEKDWTKLADNLKRFVRKPAFFARVDLLELYDGFIRMLQCRIDILQYLDILIPVAKLISVKDWKQSLDFIESFNDAVVTNPAAKVKLEFLKFKVRLYHYRVLKIDCADILQKIIVDAQALVKDLPERSHAEFHRQSASCLMNIGCYDAYYRSVMRYLACQPPLKANDKRMYAKALVLASLLAKDICFDTLLKHPILQSLRKTSDEWLIELLEVFNSGNLVKLQNDLVEIIEQFQLKAKSQFPTEYTTHFRLTNRLLVLCLTEWFGMLPDAASLGPDLTALNSTIVPQDVEFLVVKPIDETLVNKINWQFHRVMEGEDKRIAMRDAQIAIATEKKQRFGRLYKVYVKQINAN